MVRVCNYPPFIMSVEDATYLMVHVFSEWVNLVFCWEMDVQQLALGVTVETSV